MPSINMIAVRREEKRRQEQNIRKLLYAILGEIGLVVLVAFVLTARILVTQNQVGRLSERVNALQPSVTKIQQLQSETAELMPKVQTLDGAKAIYQRDYWTKAGCDKLPPPLAMLVFDAAVSSGPGRAARWLQEAVGVAQDGLIGPITLAAVAAHQGQGMRLLATYQAIRLRFMTSLPQWSHNRGWADRLMVVLLASTQMEALA